MPGPPYGFGAHTDPSVFIPLMNDYLATKIVDPTTGSWTRNNVFWLQPDDMIHNPWPVANSFAIDFIPNFPVDYTESLGGGNINTAFDSTLILWLYDRISNEIVGLTPQELEAQMIHTSLLTKQINTAMQTYPGPVDVGQDLYMFRRPLLLKSGMTQRTIVGYENSRWNLVEFTYELSFVQDLGISWPGG